MCHPFFDELRDPETKLPDSRHPNNAARDLPDLFDFSRHGMIVPLQLGFVFLEIYENAHSN